MVAELNFAILLKISQEPLRDVRRILADRSRSQGRSRGRRIDGISR